MHNIITITEVRICAVFWQNLPYMVRTGIEILANMYVYHKICPYFKEKYQNTRTASDSSPTYFGFNLIVLVQYPQTEVKASAVKQSNFFLA
jgi:hypothetical protein